MKETQEYADDEKYLKSLRIEPDCIERIRLIFTKLKLEDGSIKGKMRKLYALAAPFDAALQQYYDGFQPTSSGQQADMQGHDNEFTSCLSEISLCAFIGHHLYRASTRWLKYDDWKTILYSYTDLFAIHHDHFSGVIYGPVHKRCNSKVRIGTIDSQTINVYAHWGRYDFTLLLRGVNINTLLNIQMDKQSIKLYGTGSNAFDYMLLGSLFFKDSIKMFPSSLAELCGTKSEEECELLSDMLYTYLSEESEYFKPVYSMVHSENPQTIINERWRKLFLETTSHRLKKKGLFPYDYATEKVLNVKAPFPPKNVFYNNLREEDCTWEEYENARIVYLETGCQSLENYNELYCVQDAINLAILCTKRASKLYKMYGAHIFNYTSMSSYSFSSMLRTEASIIQCTPDMALMSIIELCIRGGFSASITSIAVDTRFKKLSYFDGILLQMVIGVIRVCDENNEYGGAMTHPMPTHGYRYRTDIKTYEQLMQAFDLDNEDTPRGFWALVDMYLPDECQEKESQINFSNVFCRELTDSRELSPLQLLRFRVKSKRMLKKGDKTTEAYLKIHLNAKNQASFRPKHQHWEYGRLLKQQVAVGWVVTKVHLVLEYRQTRFLKGYVERNQKLRQLTKNPVDSNLCKFMNNTLFGKLCSKVKGRKEHSVIFDEQLASELYDVDCEREGNVNKWKDTPEYRELQAFKTYQDDMKKMCAVEVTDDNLSDIMIAKERCRERLDEKCHEVELLKNKRKEWHGKYTNQVNPRTSLQQLAQAMRDPRTSQCVKLNEDHNAAIEYIVTRTQKKTTVKFERLVAACILAEAKMSITSFNQDYYATMQKFKNHFDYAPWVANLKEINVSIINTDTDSLAFWTRGHFKDNSSLGDRDFNDAYWNNTNAYVPDEQEFDDFTEFLLQTYMPNKIDTANYPKDHKYYTDKYKKNLHRFQRDTTSPNYIRRIIAVNPKEYFIEKSNDTSVKKHKGVKKNTKLTVNTYLDNIKTVNDIYNCLDETLTVEKFKQERLQLKAGVVTKVISQKVALSRLHDKRYIFSDGVTSLPFGHCWLKAIFENNKSLTEQQLQSSSNIRRLLEIEKHIVSEHEYLNKFMNLIAQNKHIRFAE